MKIYSKFKDYYDGAGWVDPTYLWCRNTEYNKIGRSTPQGVVDIEGDAFRKRFPTPTSTHVINCKTGEKYYDYRYGYLFFCGEVHLVMCIWGSKYKFGEEFDGYYWDDKIHDVLTKVGIDINIKPDYRWLRSNHKEFLDNFGKDCHDVNLKYKAPIVFYSNGMGSFREGVNAIPHSNIMVNCNLGYMGFASVVDPYTARQTIENFLRNDLVEEKPVQPLDDKYRIVGHGFDLKTSFRKDTPPTRKIKH